MFIFTIWIKFNVIGSLSVGWNKDLWLQFVSAKLVMLAHYLVYQSYIHVSWMIGVSDVIILIVNDHWW